ncbi:MAG: hypothetical protein KKE73_07720 [Proteobacteria bacterium]|nr:hypothetical protein [Pseudomonadota bacterium]
MDNIIQRHALEMKALRRSLSNSKKQLHEQRMRSDQAVAELKRRVTDIPLAVQEPKVPFHARILSFIF